MVESENVTVSSFVQIPQSLTPSRWFHKIRPLCVTVVVVIWPLAICKWCPTTLTQVRSKCINLLRSLWLPTLCHGCRNGVRKLGYSLNKSRPPRFVQGTEAETPYAFYHWEYIDIFNYFSHNMVTIPPVGWTNAAHKHGVVVIGEPRTSEPHCQRVCEWWEWAIGSFQSGVSHGRWGLVHFRVEGTMGVGYWLILEKCYVVKWCHWSKGEFHRETSLSSFYPMNWVLGKTNHWT